MALAVRAEVPARKSPSSYFTSYLAYPAVKADSIALDSVHPF